MDFTAAYCPVRRQLEERGWTLVSKLSEAASRLFGLVGNHSGAFNETKRECEGLRADIVDANQNLREHRSEHGC